MTDALQFVAENTAMYVKGRYLPRRFFDIIAPAPVETRTAEEIIDDMKRRIGGEAE